MRACFSSPALALLCFAAPAVGAAAKVGDPAPALEPMEWLNTKGPTSWKDMKGRLVLIEKWATW